MNPTAIHFAPEDSVNPVLGRTLPSILDEACEINYPTPAVAELTDDGESVTYRDRTPGTS